MTITAIQLSRPRNYTLEDLVFDVDYNDASAADPPLGTVFQSQHEIDNFLASNGATNFKHLELVYAALPMVIPHNVLIRLAAGVHRPSPTPLSAYYAISLTGKMVIDQGSVKITGASPSSWETISGLSGLAIDSHVATSDPSVYVGTSNPNAFAGLDLRGCYVVLSTGQATPIIDNDDNNLWVVAGLSPEPVDGVDTITVARPSTIIRNSQDDSTSFAQLFIFLAGENTAVFSGVTLEDVTLDPFACVNMLEFSNMNLGCTRVMFDHVTYTQPPYSLVANGHGIDVNGHVRATFDNCSFRSAVGNGVDGSFGPGVNSDQFFMFVVACFFMGGDRDDGFRIAGGGTSVRAYGTVFVDHPVYIRECAEIDFFDTDYYGRYCEIRDVGAGYPGLVFERRGHGLQLSENNIHHRVIFKNITGPCVRLHNGTVDASSTWVDGGGNTDVGVELVGPFSELSMSAGTDVSGSVGDVRDSDGTILSHTTIQSTGPLISGLNYLEKE